MKVDGTEWARQFLEERPWNYDEALAYASQRPFLRVNIVRKNDKERSCQTMPDDGLGDNQEPRMKAYIVPRNHFTHCPICAKAYDLRPEGKVHKCEVKKR